jgi:hypothetical protein
MMVSDENPYSPPPSTTTTRGKTSRLVLNLTNTMLLSQLLVLLVAIAFASFEVQTIVISAVPLVLVGLINAVLASRRTDTIGMVLGVSAPTFCVFVFLMIYSMKWNTVQATTPVLASAIIYFLNLLLAISIHVWRLSPADRTTR